MDLRKVYDAIAESWSRLKTRPFSFVLDFIKKKGSFLVEGCGAGRHSSLIPGVVGIDFSFSMIKLAREKDPKGKYLVADVRALPFKDGVFDYSLSIAVLHHLPPKAAFSALHELKRVTKRECLISVWSKEQPRFESGPSEVLVPFSGHERYYYLYTKKEFNNLVSKVFTEVQDVPDVENIVFISKV